MKEKVILKLTPEESEDYFGGECYKVGRREYHKIGCDHRYKLERIYIPSELEEYKIKRVISIAKRAYPNSKISLIKRNIQFSRSLYRLTSYGLPYNYIRPSRR